jgi:3-phosphoshikimate 1-carboxyvinyltransferase
VRLTPPAHLNPLNISIPGDISSAAFLIVAACILPGSQLEIKHVGLNPTRTGLLDALRQMGANIEVNLDREDNEENNEPSGTIVVNYTELRGTNIAGDLVVRMIDEFPAFAVAAAYAEGETTVSQAPELRYKETDRISTLCQEFSKLGVNCAEKPDGFTIQGQQSIRGGTATSHGDHRLGMALCILGLKSDKPTQIETAEIISESFPGFVSTLNQLGPQIQQRE